VIAKLIESEININEKLTNIYNQTQHPKTPTPRPIISKVMKKARN
jgi:hypothetical protein